jgi:hypothetical protein
MQKLLAIFLLSAVSLTGCVETRFESPLGDNIETCDANWKGLWSIEKPNSDDPAALWVDEECRFTALDQPEKGGPFKQVHIPVNYVHDDGKDYLVISDVALKGIVEVKAPYGIDPAPAKSFFFTKYRTRGDRIEIFAVDDAAVAKLVVDEKLQGTVSKTANELHVFVRGDRKQMLEISRRDSIFSSKPKPILYRIKQTPSEYEQTVIQSQRAKKP